jgi:hypothetical protein
VAALTDALGGDAARQQRQILLHAETRSEVAASLADEATNPTSDPVPVEDSATAEETEPVELVRMPTLPEPKATDSSAIAGWPASVRLRQAPQLVAYGWKSHRQLQAPDSIHETLGRTAGIRRGPSPLWSGR